MQLRGTVGGEYSSLSNIVNTVFLLQKTNQHMRKVTKLPLCFSLFHWMLILRACYNQSQ